MKVSEFEARLATVSDAKLRQMLSASRATGPEVAVNLILSEGRKRGMADFGAEANPEATLPAAVATSAYSREGAGDFGSDAPSDVRAESPAPEPASPEAPALSPKWLAEETKSGLPMPVKVVLVTAVLGALLAAAWKFAR